uniref:Uncharacterized protein n=1 Tax=Rhizophora mucronata TaxID=61149 RepID=A0A2P2QYB1_RHIMU
MGISMNKSLRKLVYSIFSTHNKRTLKVEVCLLTPIKQLSIPFLHADAKEK